MFIVRTDACLPVYLSNDMCPLFALPVVELEAIVAAFPCDTVIARAGYTPPPDKTPLTAEKLRQWVRECGRDLIAVEEDEPYSRYRIPLEGVDVNKPYPEYVHVLQRPPEIVVDMESKLYRKLRWRHAPRGEACLYQVVPAQHGRGAYRYSKTARNLVGHP